MKKVIIIIAFLSLVACQSPNYLNVKKNLQNIQLGTSLNLIPLQYLDYSVNIGDSEIKRKLYKIDDDFNKTEINIDSKENILLDVGKYILQYKYKEEIEEIEVNVEDTLAPQIAYRGSETFIVGEKPVDVLAFVTVDDFGETIVEMKGKIDFNTVGIYPIKFIATDSVGNQTYKTINFNVINP